MPSAAERRAPSAERRAPSAERRAPSAERRAPSAERRAPSCAERRAPSAERRAPSAERERRAPSAERRAPSAERRAPSAERRAPSAVTAPRAREQRRPPSPDGLPPRRGGGSSPYTYAVSAAGRPAGFARLRGARHGLVRSARALAAAALLALSCALALPATAQAQNVSEPPGEDLPDGTATTGSVAVGGSVTGAIGQVNDIDAFAVDMVQGLNYGIDVEGVDTSQGTLADPELYGVYRADHCCPTDFQMKAA